MHEWGAMIGPTIREMVEGGVVDMRAVVLAWGRVA